MSLGAVAAVAAVCTVPFQAVRADAPPSSTGCGAHGVAVQILGSGGPELQDKRASSSYLIWREGHARVLVDIGGGAALRFGQSGATVSDLDVILLTHLHVDHTADLPALVKSSFFEDRTRKLPLYGPGGNQDFPTTSAFMRTLFAAPAGAYRYLGYQQLEPHTVSPAATGSKQIHDMNGIQVTTATVIHGDVPALAYRVDVDGVSIAFSGDTDGNNGNLDRLARNANILVAHNAVPEGATGVERALHMPPSVIGRIAHNAGVKQLVLSHRMLRTLGHESATLAAIQTSFSGPVSFADDLQCFRASP